MTNNPQDILEVICPCCLSKMKMQRCFAFSKIKKHIMRQIGRGYLTNSQEESVRNAIKLGTIIGG